jgi:hypothetical protein
MLAASKLGPRTQLQARKALLQTLLRQLLLLLLLLRLMTMHLAASKTPAVAAYTTHALPLPLS